LAEVILIPAPGRRRVHALAVWPGLV